MNMNLYNLYNVLLNSESPCTICTGANFMIEIGVYFIRDRTILYS